MLASLPGPLRAHWCGEIGAELVNVSNATAKLGMNEALRTNRGSGVSADELVELVRGTLGRRCVAPPPPR